jgi:hypothetical protein
VKIEACPKCNSDKGYFFKNTGSFKELHGFNGLIKDGIMETSVKGRNAFCISCERRLEDLDRSLEMKQKKSEYYKVIADGKDQGIILKTHKQKVRAMKVLRGIKLVTATEEDIQKYNG